VTVEDLTRRYGDTVALDDVSFEVEPNEVFALVGPNGAGKTTIVEILECLRTPTSGSASVLGHDTVAEPDRVKERIGVVPQSFHTFDRLTVRENVSLVRRLYDEGPAVATILERLDLTDYADTRFAALSGGYQRRTGLAMALVSDPEVLFLDEPTTGLDPAARRATWDQVRHLTDLGTTVVLTTHYMAEVEELADRVALLVDGRLEAVDAVDSLVEAYGGEVKLVVETGEDDAAVESALRDAATEVYRDESGALVGLFEDRLVAQETFGRLHELSGDRSIDLTAAGMDEVFLRLAGTTLDSRGEAR